MAGGWAVGGWSDCGPSIAISAERDSQRAAPALNIPIHVLGASCGMVRVEAGGVRTRYDRVLVEFLSGAHARGLGIVEGRYSTTCTCTLQCVCADAEQAGA